MKLNKFKVLLVSLSIGLLAGSVVHAVTSNFQPGSGDESPNINTGFPSMMGVVEQSTGIAPLNRTRRLVTDDEGRLKTYPYAVTRSSWMVVDFSSNVNVMNSLQSTTSVNNVGYKDNQHVFRICSSSQPCGPLTLINGVGFANVRVFDTRGSTDTGIVWQGTVGSSNPVVVIPFEFSSGTVIMKQGGSISSFWEPSKEAGDGMTR